MTLQRAILAVAGAAIWAATPASAQASFQGLGDLPGGATGSSALGVSGDGSVAVGDGQGPLGQEAVRWSDSLPVGLGDLPGGIFGSRAYGVAQSDSVVVGYSWVANGAEAFRWSEATGIVGLGDLPGGNFESIAHDVSADGSVVVGEGVGADDGTQAFRWTAAGGMVGLGDLPGGGKPSSYAHGVSADGQVVVGRGRTDNGTEAFMWTPAGGMVSLGTLPDPGAGGSASSANAVSDDGTVIVGRAGTQAFRWTSASGMVGLGFPPGATGSDALAVSANGAVVVGGSGGGTSPGAFIWTAQEGMRSLRDVLIAAGVDMDGWTLQQATGVSSDGSVIVGIGNNPQGLFEAWRAVLPHDCSTSFADAHWISPDGGGFGIGSNWLEGLVPGEGDVAIFELPEGVDYSVSFAAAHQNESTSIQGGNDVRFVLGGHTYSLAGTAGECGPSLRVGNSAEPAVLTVQQGSLLALAGMDVQGAAGTEVIAEAGGTVSAGGGVTLAAAPESHAVMRARDGGGVAVLAGSSVVVGGAGDGSVHALAGGTIAIGPPVRVATEDGAIGLMSADGVGAALSMTGPADIAERGLGFLAAFHGGTIIASDVFVGREAGAVGTINVSSAVLQATRLLLGIDGEGFLLVEPGGVLTVPAFLAIPGGSGQGNATVSGAGAVVETGILTLGGSGAGQLTVGPGGFVGADVFSALPGGQLELLFGCMRIGAVTECGPARGGGGDLAADTVWVSPGAVLDVGGVALGPGGVLGGAGAIALDLTNAGTINPGDSAGVAGTFTIGGAYTQAPAGALEIELGGSAAGAYDHLAVAGAAALDGTLRFSHIAEFTPVPGDMFDVLTGGSVAGAFASVEGPPGCTYSLAYGPTTVTSTVLTVAAEPPADAAGLVLHAPAPNPASGPITLRYELPVAGVVRLSIHDALGREVAVLVDGERPAGAGAVILDAGDLAPGLYVARMEAGGAGARRLITLVR